MHNFAVLIGFVGVSASDRLGEFLLMSKYYSTRGILCVIPPEFVPDPFGKPKPGIGAFTKIIGSVAYTPTLGIHIVVEKFTTPNVLDGVKLPHIIDLVKEGYVWKDYDIERYSEISLQSKNLVELSGPVARFEVDAASIYFHIDQGENVIRVCYRPDQSKNLSIVATKAARSIAAGDRIKIKGLLVESERGIEVQIRSPEFY